jgi:hypothetical protein
MGQRGSEKADSNTCLCEMMTMTVTATSKAGEEAQAFSQDLCIGCLT